jgi:SAM-dependent methyltransferase
MTTSNDISSRFWNLPQKAGEEIGRESAFIDDIIAKAHTEREIVSHLDGVQTVFDGGAGYGRFSVLLAKRGLQATHFDISMPMIEKAKELAAQAGALGNMTFVHGSLEDLSEYRDGQFDMVLSFDAPISYTYPNHEKVISELVRICGKRLIISVYSRLAWTYQFDPAQKVKYILDKESGDPFARWQLDVAAGQVAGHRPDMEAVRSFFRAGLMEPPEQTAMEYEKGKTPWPVSYAFMPDELRGILERSGAINIRLAGPGALSRSIPGEVLRNTMLDETLKRDFLDFCYWYDSQPGVCAMGKDNLLASAEIRSGNSKGRLNFT